MDTSEGEYGRKHAQIFPVKLLLFLCQQQRLDEAVWHILYCVHAGLHSPNHGPVNLHDAVVKPTST